MYGPQNVTIDNYLLLRIPDDKGGPGNPYAPIGINAFRTTNFWYRSAMPGAEFHGDTRLDVPTRIPSINLTLKIEVIYLKKKKNHGSPREFFS